MSNPTQNEALNTEPRPGTRLASRSSSGSPQQPTLGLPLVCGDCGGELQSVVKVLPWGQVRCPLPCGVCAPVIARSTTAEVEILRLPRGLTGHPIPVGPDVGRLLEVGLGRLTQPDSSQALVVCGAGSQVVCQVVNWLQDNPMRRDSSRGSTQVNVIRILWSLGDEWSGFRRPVDLVELSLGVPLLLIAVASSTTWGWVDHVALRLQHGLSTLVLVAPSVSPAALMESPCGDLVRGDPAVRMVNLGPGRCP